MVIFRFKGGKIKKALIYFTEVDVNERHKRPLFSKKAKNSLLHF